MTRNALGSIALQTMICHLSFHQHYLPTAGKIIMNFIYNVPLPVLKTSSKLQNNDDLTTGDTCQRKLSGKIKEAVIEHKSLSTENSHVTSFQLDSLYLENLRARNCLCSL